MSSQIPSIFSRYFNIYLPNEVEMRTLQGSRPYTGMVVLPFFRVPVCVSWSSVSLMHLTCLLCSSRISFISLLRRGTPCHRGIEVAPQIAAGAAPPGPAPAVACKLLSIGYFKWGEFSFSFWRNCTYLRIVPAPPSWLPSVRPHRWGPTQIYNSSTKLYVKGINFTRL